MQSEIGGKMMAIAELRLIMSFLFCVVFPYCIEIMVTWFGQKWESFCPRLVPPRPQIQDKVQGLSTRGLLGSVLRIPHGKCEGTSNEPAGSGGGKLGRDAALAKAQPTQRAFGSYDGPLELGQQPSWSEQWPLYLPVDQFRVKWPFSDKFSKKGGS